MVKKISHAEIAEAAKLSAAVAAATAQVQATAQALSAAVANSPEVEIDFSKGSPSQLWRAHGVSLKALEKATADEAKWWKSKGI